MFRGARHAADITNIRAVDCDGALDGKYIHFGSIAEIAKQAGITGGVVDAQARDCCAVLIDASKSACVGMLFGADGGPLLVTQVDGIPHLGPGGGVLLRTVGQRAVDQRSEPEHFLLIVDVIGI